MKLTNLLKSAFLRIFVCAIVLSSAFLLLSSKKITKDGSDRRDLTVETVVTGLNMPWATAFLPEGDMLVTERVGKLRLVKNGKLDPIEISGVPAVYYRGQGGLLDVALHPDYATNGWIYISYSSPKKDGEEGEGANTALFRAKLKDHALTEIQHLYKAFPNVRTSHHYGGRIVFDKKGFVFLSLGERGQMTAAQELNKAQGKVVRLREDGKIPADNPFVNTAGAKPEVWSFGHRNPQGMMFDPTTGTLWEHEHGPQGGDELNIVEKGKNYGWPVITYGIDYDGSTISTDTAKAGLEQPITYWKPSIAPCGMDFISSDKYKGWKGNLLVGSLKFNHLQRLVISGNKVTKREIIAEKIGRVRDIRQAPDGFIYVVVEDSGSIKKLVPKG